MCYNVYAGFSIWMLRWWTVGYLPLHCSTCMCVYVCVCVCGGGGEGGEEGGCVVYRSCNV